MSMEIALRAAVIAVCPRFAWDQADIGTATPYVVAQAIGGRSVRFLNNDPASKRNTVMQITTWAKSRMESTTLARQVEDAVCAAPALQASPNGEPTNLHDPDTKLFGSLQLFSIWANRAP